jgi:hypothetical protein
MTLRIVTHVWRMGRGICSRCRKRPARKCNGICAVCNRQYIKARNHTIIRKTKNRPCMDCGRRYPYYVMDFDHVRGKKLFNIGQPAQRGASKLLAEILKCDIICANCHRARTHWRRIAGKVVDV